jgi:hypothetical protein
LRFGLAEPSRFGQLMPTHGHFTPMQGDVVAAGESTLGIPLGPPMLRGNVLALPGVTVELPLVPAPLVPTPLVEPPPLLPPLPTAAPPPAWANAGPAVSSNTAAVTTDFLNNINASISRAVVATSMPSNPTEAGVAP